MKKVKIFEKAHNLCCNTPIHFLLLYHSSIILQYKSTNFDHCPAYAEPWKSAFVYNHIGHIHVLSNFIAYAHFLKKRIAWCALRLDNPQLGVGLPYLPPNHKGFHAVARLRTLISLAEPSSFESWTHGRQRVFLFGSLVFQASIPISISLCLYVWVCICISM